MGTPMRIAMVVPPWIALPPEGYGGIESVCAALVDGLVDRGHDVTVYGVGHGRTKGRYVRCGEPQYERIGQTMPEVVHAAVSAQALNADPPDIVHDHSTAGLLLARSRRAPTVATMHGPVHGELGDYARALGSAVQLVAISRDQRRRAPDLAWRGVVHNAVPVHSFPFGAAKEDFALFLGRCSPEKGLDRAILASRRAGLRLLIGAKCIERPEKEYFEQRVRPLLGPDVSWLGEVAGDRKLDLLRRARCLLFPIEWEEPFGMVMIEALSCGTPVVALRRGAVPEIIEDGVTGLLTSDVGELPRLLHEVTRLDPAACRQAAETRFDVSLMVAAYEELYRRVLTDRLAGRRLVSPPAPVRVAAVPADHGHDELALRRSTA